MSTHHKHAARELILRALSIRPGAGPSQLVAMTGKGWGSVEQALYRLVREDLVCEVRRGRSKAFFLSGQEVSRGNLVRGAALRLLDAVKAAPGSTAAELSDRTGMAVSEISRLGGRLEQDGCLGRVRMDRHVFFVPVQPAVA